MNVVPPLWFRKRRSIDPPVVCPKQRCQHNSWFQKNKIITLIFGFFSEKYNYSNRISHILKWIISNLDTKYNYYDFEKYQNQYLIDLTTLPEILKGNTEKKKKKLKGND